MTGPGSGSPPADDPAERLGRALAGRGLRIAVAESCTGGLVMKRLTDVPGSSGWLEGGVVAYADQVKRALLGVPDAVLASQGAVSEETARAMAEGVAVRLGTGVGLAVTGIAGPGGGVAGKPVGTVWIAAVVSGAIRVQRLQLHGDRSQVRESAARRALEMTLEALEGPGSDPANPEVRDG